MPHQVERFLWLGLTISLLLMAGCQSRLPPPAVEPVTLAPTLPVPYTRPQSGTLGYGATVQFGVDSLPTGATVEYSSDNGQHWQTGDSLVLQTATAIQLRTKQGPYVSAASKAAFAVGFKRVLIIGNSITWHAPEPTVGWLGNWGMAASAPEKDYVHLLTDRLHMLDSQVVVKTYNAVPFEEQFWSFDYSELRPLAAFKPDLVVMRIGENVPVASVSSRNFKQHYQRLIDSLTVNYAPVKIICSTSFFDQPTTSAIIRQVATDRKYYLSDFYGLVNNRSFQAYDQFKDRGVASHPGDKGMLAITDLIWDKIP